MPQSGDIANLFDVQEGQLDMTLYRPRDGRIIAGVCSGIARPQILIYLAAWLLMPDETATVA